MKVYLPLPLETACGNELFNTRTAAAAKGCAYCRRNPLRCGGLAGEGGGGGGGGGWPSNRVVITFVIVSGQLGAAGEDGMVLF